MCSLTTTPAYVGTCLEYALQSSSVGDGIPCIRHIWQSTPWGYQCTPAAHPQRCLIGHTAPVCSAASTTFSQLDMANKHSSDVKSSDYNVSC